METDVLIHINDDLDAAARQALERGSSQAAGVTQARFCGGKEHLLLVSYNPAATRAGEILEAVRGKGVQAQLVGL